LIYSSFQKENSLNSKSADKNYDRLVTIVLDFYTFISLGYSFLKESDRIPIHPKEFKEAVISMSALW
jgi:hypothetical protein